MFQRLYIVAGRREVGTFRKERERNLAKTLERSKNRKGEKGKRIERMMDG